MALFAASCDTLETNTKFAKSLMLDYPILSDPKRTLAKQHGVVDAKRKFPRRHTIYVGKNGKVLYIDTKVKPRTHGKDVAKKLAELGVAKAN